MTQSRGTGQAYAALGIRSSTTALEHFYIVCALLGRTAGLMQHLTFKGIENLSNRVYQQAGFESLLIAVSPLVLLHCSSSLSHNNFNRI